MKRGDHPAEASASAERATLADINEALSSSTEFKVPSCHTLILQDTGQHSKHEYGDNAGRQHVDVRLYRARGHPFMVGDASCELLLRQKENHYEVDSRCSHYKHYQLMCAVDVPLAQHGALAMCYEPFGAWSPCQVMLQAAAGLVL